MPTKEISSSTKLKNFFLKKGFKLNEKQINQFHLFYQLLTKYNEKFDLSRLKSFQDISIKHFIDSIYITKLALIPSPLLDIGTGPGFPGIPLKIFNPNLKIILAEPRHKRVAFLKIVLQELNLTDIEIYPHLVNDKSFFEVQGIITRALETIDKTLTRVNHFLPQNGQVLFLKGPETDQDFSTLSSKNKKLYNLADNIPYNLPGTEFKRKLIIFKKLESTLKKNYQIYLNQENIGLVIQSKENKKFKKIKQIAAFDKFEKNNKILIAGKKIITDSISSSLDHEELILFDGYQENDQKFEKIINNFAKQKKLIILKKSLYNELDSQKTEQPLLIIKARPINSWNLTLSPGCNLAIPFQDPTNVGTAIRSALGFGIENIILLKESCHPFHPKVIRSSAGAVLTANLKKGPSLSELKKIMDSKKIALLSLDQEGQNIKDFSFPRSFLFLPGIEGPGLPQELKLNSLAIPIDQKIESLNAAVATSLALYEWHRNK